jgi:hypothetical protein
MKTILEGQSAGDIFPNILLESLKSRLAMTEKEVIICQLWHGDILAPQGELQQYLLQQF